MDVNPKQRRRHSAEFKAQVLAACAEPGAPVAAVALSFGLNDNLVHQWRRGRGASPKRPEAATTVADPAGEFVAVWSPTPAQPPAPGPSATAATRAETIRLELKRGTLGV